MQQRAPFFIFALLPWPLEPREILEITQGTIHLTQVNFCSENTVSLLCLLTLRRLISYIYMEHPFLMFLDHTQRRSTVGRTPLDE